MRVLHRESDSQRIDIDVELDESEFRASRRYFKASYLFPPLNTRCAIISALNPDTYFPYTSRRHFEILLAFTVSSRLCSYYRSFSHSPDRCPVETRCSISSSAISASLVRGHKISQIQNGVRAMLRGSYNPNNMEVPHTTVINQVMATEE